MRNGVWLPKGSTVYWMKLSVGGQVVRESTGLGTEDQDVRFRERRLQELEQGDSVPHEKRLTLKDLRELHLGELRPP